MKKAKIYNFKKLTFNAIILFDALYVVFKKQSPGGIELGLSVC